MGYRASREREYGIGRVPADVDQAEEALAEFEAQQRLGLVYRPAQAGDTVYPAGTTPGRYTPGARCATCGRPATAYNPSAGRHLCERHWDEY